MELTFMYKEDRLPHNVKEGILFMLIISFLSVNTIAPIIMFLEKGFSMETYIDALKIFIKDVGHCYFTSSSSSRTNSR